MPSKMIPFPYKTKITHSGFCYYGIYYSNTDRQGGSFLFYFFISIIMALGRTV